MGFKSTVFILGLAAFTKVYAAVGDYVSFDVYGDSSCTLVPDNVFYDLYNDADNKGSGCVSWAGGGNWVDGGVFYPASGSGGAAYPGRIYFFLDDVCSDATLGSSVGTVDYNDHCVGIGGGISGNTVGGVCWSPTSDPHNDCSGGGVARKRGLGGGSARNITRE